MMQILAHGHLGGGHFLAAVLFVVVLALVLSAGNSSNSCNHRRC